MKLKIFLLFLQKFLLHGNMSELKQNEDDTKKINNDSKGISLTDVSVSWNQDHRNILNAVTFNVKPGELTAVVGPVGSGKVCLSK